MGFHYWIITLFEQFFLRTCCCARPFFQINKQFDFIRPSIPTCDLRIKTKLMNGRRLANNGNWRTKTKLPYFHSPAAVAKRLLRSTTVSELHLRRLERISVQVLNTTRESQGVRRGTGGCLNKKAKVQRWTQEIESIYESLHASLELLFFTFTVPWFITWHS